MTVEMAIWRMTPEGPLPVPPSKLDFEQRLEDMIANDPGLVGLPILVVGRQVATKFGGFVDVLGVDADGRVHVIELKRDRTPREVVAQVLDYGAWAQNLTLADAAEVYQDRIGGALDEAFAEHFGVPVPDAFDADQQLTIVASELDAASGRIVEYLATRYDVPVNAVFFRHFKDGGAEYLARTWLRPPEEATTKRQTKAAKVRPGTAGLLRRVGSDRPSQPVAPVPKVPKVRIRVSKRWSRLHEAAPKPRAGAPGVRLRRRSRVRRCRGRHGEAGPTA